MNASEKSRVQSVNKVVYHSVDVVSTVVCRNKIHDHYPKPIRTNFDCGAQVNFMSYERVSELKIRRTAVSHNFPGVDGGRLPTRVS